MIPAHMVWCPLSLLGNTMISQTGGNGFVDAIRLSLDESDCYSVMKLRTLASQFIAGKEFIRAKIEVILTQVNFQ